MKQKVCISKIQIRFAFPIHTFSVGMYLNPQLKYSSYGIYPEEVLDGKWVSKKKRIGLMKYKSVNLQYTLGCWVAQL